MNIANCIFEPHVVNFVAASASVQVDAKGLIFDLASYCSSGDARSIIAPPKHCSPV